MFARGYRQPDEESFVSGGFRPVVLVDMGHEVHPELAKRVREPYDLRDDLTAYAVKYSHAMSGACALRLYVSTQGSLAALGM